MVWKESPPMQPDQAKFLSGYLLPQLESEHAVTKRILRAIPPHRSDYRPAPESRSAFQVARHIAGTEIWFLEAVIHRRFEDIEPMPPSIQTGSDVAQWYEEHFAQRLPVLESLSGEHLATPVDYLGLRNDPAVAYLNIAIRHSVHHRGQLSAYLRPMGVRVPAIYVESCDEPFPPDAETANPRQPPPAF